MPEEPSLSEDERAELERLRAEVAELQARERDGAAPGRRAPRRRWRAIVATVLIVVACVLAPLALVAVWTNNQVSDTDRYVATVSPLADDPAIQNAIADQITAELFKYIDVEGITDTAVDALASQGLNPQRADQLRALVAPIADGVESFTRSQVGKVVQSDAFADAWVQANRAAHAELVKALTGEGGGAVTIENDTVNLNLAAFIQTVKEQLTAAGFDLAARIPEVQASFPLFRSAEITKVRSTFHLLDNLATWLPIIVLFLLAIGVYVAKDHRRTLVGAGLGLTAGMVVLALALALGRSAYLDAVPASVLPHDAAAVLFDTIVRFLRTGLRTVAVLGLVVAAGAFLSGGSVTAVRSRPAIVGALGWRRGGAGAAGLRPGPVGVWVSCPQ